MLLPSVLVRAYRTLGTSAQVSPSFLNKVLSRTSRSTRLVLRNIPICADSQTVVCIKTFLQTGPEQHLLLLRSVLVRAYRTLGTSIQVSLSILNPFLSCPSRSTRLVLRNIPICADSQTVAGIKRLLLTGPE